MESALRTSVEKIRKKFQVVFKDIFRGGEADLK
jgi:chromosome segregation ATPase